MAIPRFLRSMFGADAVDDEIEGDVEFDDIDAPAAGTPAAAPSSQAPGGDADVSDELLDAILAQINGQLPPIAVQCIDRAAQRRYLADALGPALAQYAGALRRRILGELTGDRAKIQSELEELRAERKETIGKREEQKAALLSEQRQRRALTDRNRDLESKIDELDSQIEQHKLTIASLMNKLRVAEVTEGDSEALRAEIVRLGEQLEAAKAELTEKDNEITSLSEKIAGYEAASALEAALAQRREAAGETAADPEPAEAEQTAAPKKRRTRTRRKPAYNPDDDSTANLDSVDWLLPGGAPAGHVGHVSDPEFGYQPPKQAPAPDSDAQLTLF